MTGFHIMISLDLCSKGKSKIVNVYGDDVTRNIPTVSKREMDIA